MPRPHPRPHPRLPAALLPLIVGYGHLYGRCGLAVYGVVACLALAGVPVHAVVAWPMLVSMVAGLGAEQVHARRYCDWCTRALPLDTQAQIARNRYALRTWHRLPRSGRLLAGLTALWAASLAVAFGGRAAGVPVEVSGRIALGMLVGPIAVLGLVSQIHQRLRPWCPWCRRGGGGEEPGEPEPGPSHGKPLLADR
ncbi:hypothetical protein [Bailinhaonella thermotolerans]|uniref:Uncharacterized protein n=1 Tax=Bailinhaonella thermotolerans TaxID=1070861 RepID=A0A3A4A649_9ACTN|nr:hypothetical protein [Bailinhaonella thermotolerans]RJL21123.1 hypothetical protein D5H75_38605 [Bailinhaonella thermotolerans]